MGRYITLCALFIMFAISTYAQTKEERITQGVITEITTTTYETVTTTESRRMTKEEWAEYRHQRKLNRQAYRDSMAAVAMARYEESSVTQDNNATRAEEAVVNGEKINSECSSLSGTIDGHDYVDMGLSVKWATCNVGADSPEDYGNYYAWGETITKSSYTKDNSKTYGMNLNDIGGDSSYDAAAVNWGSKWRLPSREEFKELRDNCDWVWTIRNGVKGYEVKSKRNGNTIFLPAAGFYGKTPRRQGSYGYYWSSVPFDTDGAYLLYLSSDDCSVYWLDRYDGQSVRPVAE